MIKVAGLSVIYANGKEALSNINFSLSSGKIYGLVGGNGAGKSTLFKSIMGFIKPSAGLITIMDEAVEKALKKSLISYVPQTEDIDWDFPVLVKDVVMMGRYGRMGPLRIPSKQDINIVHNMLDKVNLGAYAQIQINELSGGQKKLVFVARALAQSGNIFLLDEPFAGVDIKTEHILIDIFKEIAAAGSLVLVSTHNLGSVPRFCDDVLLVNRKLLAIGAVDKIFTSDNLALAFGGMLRHNFILGSDLHKDKDKDLRGVTVMTDDERALVFYGEKDGQKIVSHKIYPHHD